MDKYDYNEFVLQLFNLEDDDVQSAEYINVNGNARINVLLVDKNRPPCPCCGHMESKIKGYVWKKINHAVLSDRKCTLHYKARRYQCLYCKTTFYENNPFCFHKQKISVLTIQNVLRDLKSQNETFSSVARRYYISPTTAASIFDTHVDMKRTVLPEYMSWDECYAFHHLGYKSKYVCMLLDYKKAEPIDILPSRRKDFLLKYFDNIPKKERDNVKMVSTDMWDTYREVVHSKFPNALVSVDHYHLSQEFGRKMDSVRIRVMKRYCQTEKQKVESDEYYLLKKFNWLMFKRPDASDKDGELFDPNRKKLFNKKLNRYLNFSDIENLICAIDPQISEIWCLKEDFMDFYDNNTVDTAESELNELIERCRASGIPEVNEFAKTLKKWKQEIINSFQIVDKEYVVNADTGHVVISEKKLMNGLMENKNGILKLIKKNANGYTNWDRFHNRCLYVLRKEATASLYPIAKKKGGKK